MSGFTTSRDVNVNATVLASAARTATTVSDTFKNLHAKRLHLIIDVTVAPGVDTITPKIEGYDAVSDKFYTLLTGAAISTTGTNVLKIGPGISASANAAAADFLPSKWRVTMTHSAGTSFTYSVASQIGI